MGHNGLAAAVTRSRLVAIVVAAYALEKGNSDVWWWRKRVKRGVAGASNEQRTTGNEQRAVGSG